MAGQWSLRVIPQSPATQSSRPLPATSLVNHQVSSAVIGLSEGGCCGPAEAQQADGRADHTALSVPCPACSLHNIPCPTFSAASAALPPFVQAIMR